MAMVTLSTRNTPVRECYPISACGLAPFPLPSFFPSLFLPYPFNYFSLNFDQYEVGTHFEIPKQIKRLKQNMEML